MQSALDLLWFPPMQARCSIWFVLQSSGNTTAKQRRRYYTNHAETYVPLKQAKRITAAIGNIRQN